MSVRQVHAQKKFNIKKNLAFIRRIRSAPICPIITCCAVAPSVVRRASGSVLAGAVLRAILAECIFRAYLAAVGASKAGRAYAASVYRRALGVVLAVAPILAIFTVVGVRARPGASSAVPADAADAGAGPWMTQFSVLFVALAHSAAIRTELAVGTGARLAFLTGPAVAAGAASVDRRAGRAVLACAVARAIQTKLAYTSSSKS